MPSTRTAASRRRADAGRRPGRPRSRRRRCGPGRACCCRTRTRRPCWPAAVTTSRSGWRTSPCRRERDLAAGRRGAGAVGFPYGRGAPDGPPVRRRAAAAGAGRRARAAPGPAAARRADRDARPGRRRRCCATRWPPCWPSRAPPACSSSTGSRPGWTWSTGSWCSEPGGGVIADGAGRATCCAEHGAALAAHGVWVPGRSCRQPGGRRRRSPRDRGGRYAARGPAAGRRAAGRRAPSVPGVDLDLAAGRATALVGPNGAGKSTLAHVLAGLTRAGRRIADGDAGAGRAAAARPHRTAGGPRELVTRIGTVFQEPQHQFVASTVRDELAGRAAPGRLGAGRDRRPGRRAAAPAAPGAPGPGQPLHAQRRRAAPALGGHRAGDPAAAAGARRADLRSGLADLGRAGRPAARAAATTATGVLAVTHDEALVVGARRRRADPARRPLSRPGQAGGAR